MADGVRGTAATAGTVAAAGATAAAPRGRIQKREAILDAALSVFVREGYGLSSIDAIAAEAGVAKPTIYNHLGGKENLFRIVMIEAAEQSRNKILQALDAFPTDATDLHGQLAAIAHRVLECQVGERGWALQRLIYAEAPRFPDLCDTIRTTSTDHVTNALAARLAWLSNAGHLDIADPVLAAQQFMALISGDLPQLSALGTRPIADSELDRAVTAGVGTFLRAFTPREAAHSSAPSGPPAS
jgi:TetR/AcrR family transcriptional regulator, mexJK operon transcriptional repressor